jgi:hypothetical protein
MRHEGVKMTDYLLIGIGSDCSLKIVQTHKGHDGTTRYPAWEIARGKGLGYSRLRQMTNDGWEDCPLQTYGRGILIPVTRAVTQRIFDFLDMQRLMAQDHNKMLGPYYFTVAMNGESNFEGPKDRPHLIGGPETAYARKLSPALASRVFRSITGLWDDNTDGSFDNYGDPYGKNPEQIPFARYNCWTASQGIAQYIGGVDMARIDPAFVTAFRAARATKVFDRLEETLREGGEYTVSPIAPDACVARLGGGPPFVLLNGGFTLDELLESPMDGTDLCLEEWLDTQAVFAPMTPSRQSAPAPAV